MPSKPYPRNTSEQTRPDPQVGEPAVAQPRVRGNHTEGKWHENCFKFVRDVVATSC